MSYKVRTEVCRNVLKPAFVINLICHFRVLWKRHNFIFTEGKIFIKATQNFGVLESYSKTPVQQIKLASLHSFPTFKLGIYHAFKTAITSLQFVKFLAVHTII